MRDPAIVAKEGEEVTISKNEREFLKLGPKYCLYKRLNEENFETDLEECIMKVKWDMLGEGSDNESKKRRKSEDIALEVLLGGGKMP